MTLLQKLRALAATEAKATPGPWLSEKSPICGASDNHQMRGKTAFLGNIYRNENATLIAQSRNLLKAAIALVEAQHEALEEIKRCTRGSMSIEHIRRTANVALQLANQEQP